MSARTKANASQAAGTFRDFMSTAQMLQSSVN
jgi:hypothetical protein